MEKTFCYKFPIGKVWISERGGKICGLHFDGREPAGYTVEETDLIKLTAKQVFEYFEGRREAFDVPLDLAGTEFQRKVWAALLTVPYGETRSYKDIAVQIGNEKACRAVGMANHNNPVSIIVPCHRVKGHNGGLTGYAGGLDTKQVLLDLEKSQRKRQWNDNGNF